MNIQPASVKAVVDAGVILYRLLLTDIFSFNGSGRNLY